MALNEMTLFEDLLYSTFIYSILYYSYPNIYWICDVVNSVTYGKKKKKTVLYLKYNRVCTANCRFS